jgi:ABC-type Fe3+/spermidine/putrescine transport system ATPase subunit
MQIRTGAGDFLAETKAALNGNAAVWVGFRPEAAVIGPGPVNRLSAKILRITYLGETEQYDLALAEGTRIKVFEQNPFAIRRSGTPLELYVRPADLLVLSRDQSSS